MSKFRKDILPLHVFIRRRQILSSYRNLLKATRPCEDPDLRKDVFNQIRTEFQRNKDLQDKVVIKQCIQQASRSLKQVEEICNRQKHSPVAATTRTTSPKKNDSPVITTTSNKPVERSPPDDPSSWINVKDNIDVRGRVGSGWPWQ